MGRNQFYSAFFWEGVRNGRPPFFIWQSNKKPRHEWQGQKWHTNKTKTKQKRLIVNTLSKQSKFSVFCSEMLL